MSYKIEIVNGFAILNFIGKEWNSKEIGLNISGMNPKERDLAIFKEVNENKL